MPFELEEAFDSGVNIKVIGVGGGGKQHELVRQAAAHHA